MPRSIPTDWTEEEAIEIVNRLEEYAVDACVTAGSRHSAIHHAENLRVYIARQNRRYRSALDRIRILKEALED